MIYLYIDAYTFCLNVCFDIILREDFFCFTRNTDILSNPVPVEHKTTVKPVQNPLPTAEIEPGLPPPPSSPNAPPLPAIVKPLNGNNDAPILEPELPPFYPSLNEDINLGTDDSWIGQGVINENGEWITSYTDSSFSTSSLFNTENEDDVLTRY